MPKSECGCCRVAALVRSEWVTPLPGDHPVHRAGMDDLVGAEAVAVLELALEEVGDGGEPDVRVRPHVDALAGDELRRPGLVEEDERPDHLPLRRRQRAAHLEAAEVAGARHDQRLDGVDGVAGRAGRVEAGVPAHARSPFLQQVGPFRVPAELRRREGAERQHLLALGAEVGDRARHQRLPDPLAAEGGGHLGVVDDDEALAGLGEGHLRLVPAGAVDVAPLAAGLLQGDVVRARSSCFLLAFALRRKLRHRADLGAVDLVAARMPVALDRARPARRTRPRARGSPPAGRSGRARRR